MTPLAAQGIRTPLSPSRMTQTASLLRTVEQEGTGYKISETPPVPPSFPCSLLPSKTFSAPASDSPPRQWKNKQELFYLARKLGVEQPILQPGSRIEVEGVQYEVVSEALAERVALTVWAYKQNVLPVSQLWPLTATLVDLKGEEVPDVGPVPFAVWEGSADRFGQRGRYDDTEGEVPCDYAEAVKGQNVALTIGTRKYKIQSAHCHFAQPHVSLKLVSLDA
jgi:hypothetical protein